MIAGELEGAIHPGVERVIGGLERDQEDRAAATRDLVEQALGGIEQAAVGGLQAGARQGAGRGDGVIEADELDRGASAKARARGDPHPGLGDDAERALGAEPEAVGIGAGAGGGQAPGGDQAARGDDGHRLDEVVDVGGAGRVVTAGAGREPAAERRVLEGLREVAEGDAVRGEAGLERGAEGAGADARGTRELIDLVDAGELREIEAGDAGPVGARAERELDATDDAGAAAVGDRGDASGGAPVEDGGDVGGAARAQDDIGRGREVAGEAADQIGIAAAVGVRGAIARRGRGDGCE